MPWFRLISALILIVLGAWLLYKNADAAPVAVMWVGGR